MKILSILNKLTKRQYDSIFLSLSIIGIISSIFTILGISLTTLLVSMNIWCRVLLVFLIFLLLCILIYLIKGIIYKNHIKIVVRKTPVEIFVGNLFEVEGYKVIGCDSHFDTRVDDIVISKKSLHGQLVLKHGVKEEIELAVEKEAQRIGVEKIDNQYTFQLGTIIKYESSKDDETYLMLAMLNLDSEYKARTNMEEFERMLMHMWKEIDRVYASHDIVIPILGEGITRFNDGPKEANSLLKCILCTLNSSGVSLNSTVKVVIYGENKDIPLYEYKDLFRMMPINKK